MPMERYNKRIRVSSTFAHDLGTPLAEWPFLRLGLVELDDLIQSLWDFSCKQSRIIIPKSFIALALPSLNLLISLGPLIVRVFLECPRFYLSKVTFVFEGHNIYVCVKVNGERVVAGWKK